MSPIVPCPRCGLPAGRGRHAEDKWCPSCPDYHPGTMPDWLRQDFADRGEPLPDDVLEADRAEEELVSSYTGPLDPEPALVANTGGFFDYRIALNAVPEPGWCAPSSALYDLVTLPEITVRRGPITYPDTPPVAPPRVPWRTRMRYRVRRLRSRIRAARGAFRAPDEWWDR